MRIVFALGRKALDLQTGKLTPSHLGPSIQKVANILAPICLKGHQVIITYGNGPQAGWLAMQSAATPEHPYNFEGIDAENIGMVGYLIEHHLTVALPRRTLLAAMLTQILVDRSDPRFEKPDVPVGPVYGESEARLLGAERGWRVGPHKDGWQRMVASPKPLEVLEAPVVQMLIERNVIVICTGGGGIPVIELADGSLASVEAIVDNDAASAMLARQIDADWLMLLTDVDGVYPGWGQSGGSMPLRSTTPRELAALEITDSSMRDKVNAACSFVTKVGRRAGIGRLADAAAILDGEGGTVVSLPMAEITPEGNA